MFGNLGGMLNKVQELQKNVQNLKSEMENSSFIGSDSNGLVKVTMNGKMDPIEVFIDQEFQKITSNEILNKSILNAIQDATTKVKNEYKKRLNELTGGVPLPPGLGLPF